MNFAHAGHDHSKIAQNDMVVDPTMLVIAAGVAVLVFAGFALFRLYLASRI